jgi:hypothetical protein
MYKAKRGGRNRIESFSREMLAGSGPDSGKSAATELVIEKTLMN